MDAYDLKRLAVMIFNENISNVKDIYKGKVPDYILAHLIDKAEGYKAQHNNNTEAWIDFIANSDGKNTQILADFTTEKYGYIKPFDPSKFRNADGSPLVLDEE